VGDVRIGLAANLTPSVLFSQSGPLPSSSHRPESRLAMPDFTQSYMASLIGGLGKALLSSCAEAIFRPCGQARAKRR
jgi:hypothetical protein